MSDANLKSRKMIMFNTAVFLGASVVFFLSLFTTIFGSMLGFTYSSTIMNILLVAGYVVVGLFSFFGAWKAHANLEYGKATMRGILAWLYPLGILILQLMF